MASEVDDRRGLKDFQLWFMFDGETDAKKAFDLLSDMFEKLSKSKRASERNGRKIVEYSDQAEFDEINSVQIILTKDELHDDKYKLFFRIGSFTYSE